jgi:hypothetical protein
MIATAVKLDEIHETMKGFWKDQFPGKVNDLRPAFEIAVKRDGAKNHLSAALKIIAKCELEGMALAMVLAAAVELMREVTA